MSKVHYRIKAKRASEKDTDKSVAYSYDPPVPFLVNRNYHIYFMRKFINEHGEMPDDISICIVYDTPKDSAEVD